MNLRHASGVRFIVITVHSNEMRYALVNIYFLVFRSTVRIKYNVRICL